MPIQVTFHSYGRSLAVLLDQARTVVEGELGALVDAATAFMLPEFVSALDAHQANHRHERETADAGFLEATYALLWAVMALFGDEDSHRPEMDGIIHVVRHLGNAFEDSDSGGSSDAESDDSNGGLRELSFSAHGVHRDLPWWRDRNSTSSPAAAPDQTEPESSPMISVQPPTPAADASLMVSALEGEPLAVSTPIKSDALAPEVAVDTPGVVETTADPTAEPPLVVSDEAVVGTELGDGDSVEAGVGSGDTGVDAPVAEGVDEKSGEESTGPDLVAPEPATTDLGADDPTVLEDVAVSSAEPIASETSKPPVAGLEETVDAAVTEPTVLEVAQAEPAEPMAFTAVDTLENEGFGEPPEDDPLPAVDETVAAAAPQTGPVQERLEAAATAASNAEDLAARIDAELAAEAVDDEPGDNVS